MFKLYFDVPQKSYRSRKCHWKMARILYNFLVTKRIDRTFISEQRKCNITRNKRKKSTLTLALFAHNILHFYKKLKFRRDYFIITLWNGIIAKLWRFQFILVQTSSKNIVRSKPNTKFMFSWYGLVAPLTAYINVSSIFNLVTDFRQFS